MSAWNQCRFMLAVTFALSVHAHAQPPIHDNEWPSYARTPQGTRYSPLGRIHQDNVHRLQRAWTVRTGEILPKSKHYWEVAPLMVNNTLYVMTLLNRVLALDPVTGEQKWEFDPGFHERQAQAVRGLSYWQSRDGGRKRIILPTRDARLFSIDAETGKPDPHFDNNGMVDLRKLLGEGDNPRYMFISSPPAIYDNLIITGFGMSDASRSWIPHIPIVALDINTGQIVWRFNTVPQEGEAGQETWEGDSWFNRGGANAWSILSVDPENGIVFVPTGAVQHDFYGGDRKGENWFANSLIALDAKSGERLWHFQTVHHDLWDYDNPAQPNVVDLTIGETTIPAVALVSKTGFVYVFHRLSGEPVFPILERPVPQSDIPGEQAWPTQPFPVKPPAFSKQGFQESDLNEMFPETYPELLEAFRSLRSEGIFTPPSFEGTISFPGFHGGANWSGAAVTPDGMMYVNSTNLAGIIRMVPADEGVFRYNHTGWIRFRGPNGYPANKPPWGELNKIDLNRGEMVWQVPLGEFQELTEQGFPVTGQENLGGCTVTAGGLVFIASTEDEHIRAFSTKDGEILWEDKMQAGGYAAPITYRGEDGRQYVVICAGGGGKLGTKPGDFINAYALPKE